MNRKRWDEEVYIQYQSSLKIFTTAIKGKGPFPCCEQRNKGDVPSWAEKSALLEKNIFSTGEIFLSS